MASKITNARAIVRCDNHVDALDGGDVQLKTGAGPADADGTPSGTVVATLPLNATAFGAASDQNPGASASMQTSPAVQANSVAAGLIGHAVWRNSGGTVIHIDTVGLTSSGADIELDVVDIPSSGVQITLTSYTWTEPES